MKKRLLALLTILCLLSGCTVSLAENVGDSLVVGMVSTRTTEIRPLTPQEAGMVSLYNVVYESLVTSPIWPKNGRRATAGRPGPSPCGKTCVSPTVRP